MIKKCDKIKILNCKMNSYHIFENPVLGSGPHTKVYLGKNINVTNYDNSVDDSIVAVKVIDKKKIKNIQVLRNEIDMINRIGLNTSHDNIVTYYDIHEDDDHAYIVMEYCDSCNLFKIMDKPMKDHYVKYYMKQILNGIKFLQDRNIIHCDIKPHNILLTNNKKTIKICDFGFSKYLDPVDEIKNVESICGSPYYMAPEIFKNKQYGYYTDIWSVGIIFYEMLYNKLPFGRCDDVTLLIKKLEKHTKIIPPKFTLNMISDECVVLMQSMLQKKIENRATLIDINMNSWLWNEHDTSNNKDGTPYSFDTFTHSCSFMKNNNAISELTTSESDSCDENTRTTSSNERFKHNEKQESSNTITSNEEIFDMDI